MIRNIGNKLGIAWWAKIETDKPITTYWYGPFLTKRSLNQNLVDIESGAFSADDMTVKQTQNIEIKNLLYLLQTIPYGTSTTEIIRNPLRN